MKEDPTILLPHTPVSPQVSPILSPRTLVSPQVLSAAWKYHPRFGFSCLLALLLLLCTSFGTAAQAHQNAGEHYEELEAMLFGSRQFHESASGELLTSIRILEYASTLCIDQFGESNQTLLTGLQKWGVKGIPSSLSEINPSDQESAKLSPTNHRTYTHQGWDYSYDSEKYGDLARWPKRKTILLAAAEKVFHFSSFSGKWLFLDFGYSNQCDSLCALIYYNHLLGDYLEDIDFQNGNIKKFNGTSNGSKIPFASATSNPTDLFSELEKHLAILFRDQADDSRVYDSLLSDIRTLAARARRLSEDAEGTVSDENYEAMRDCVQELMDLLTGENGHYNAIHALLLNESFFTNVF